MAKTIHPQPDLRVAGDGRLRTMCRPVRPEEVANILGRLNDDLDDDLGAVIAGFWIDPDTYSDAEEVVVLMLVKFLEIYEDVDDYEEIEESEREAALSMSLDLLNRVAEALDPLIWGTCWFTTAEDFESEGPPLDPSGFYALEASSRAA